jgi:hypothetical protein
MVIGGIIEESASWIAKTPQKGGCMTDSELSILGWEQCSDELRRLTKVLEALRADIGLIATYLNNTRQRLEALEKEKSK